MSKPQNGRAIGSHLGKPIYESIQEEEARYTFDRLAKCDAEGCPLETERGRPEPELLGP